MGTSTSIVKLSLKGGGEEKLSIMGLDIGTSGCKCTLLDETGAIIAVASHTYTVIRSHAGHSELNPLEVWSAVKLVIANVLKADTSCGVKAVAISSFGEAVIPLGQRGEELSNSMLYTDARGQDEAEQLSRQLGAARVMELTGIPIHAMYSISKVMWLKKHQSELFSKTRMVMQFGDYISYKLTGIARIDYSLASRTMAFNLTSRSWDSSIMAAAGLDPDLFSVPIPSGDIIGHVHRQAAQETGLMTSTLVVAGGHDQACASLGAGIIKEGQAMDGIGTVECIAAAFSRPVLSDEMRHYYYNCGPHVLKDLYLTYAFNAAGSLLQWFQENYAETEHLEEQRTGIPIFELLNQKAADKPTDLLVLPHFSGSGTPHMNTSAKGLIYGLTLSTEPKHIYRALMEGITYEVLYNLDCLSTVGVQVDTLRAVGGGAKSDLWMQMKADIMNRKIETLHVSEAGTLGAAILAGVAVGIYASCEEAVAQLVKVKAEFYPDPSRLLFMRSIISVI